MRRLISLAVVAAMVSVMAAAPASAETFVVDNGATSVTVNDAFFSNEVTVDAGAVSFTVDDDFFGGDVFGDEGLDFGGAFPFDD